MKKQLDITSQHLFKARRKFLALGAASLVSNKEVMQLLASAKLDLKDLHFIQDKNLNKLQITDFQKASTYNNFYEFSTSKSKPATMARSLQTKPWELKVSGLVKNPQTFHISTLLDTMTLQERVYRFRCVEGWSMVVPWIGFELRELLAKVQPLSSAKYLRFTTLYDPKQFPNQAKNAFATIPYPYEEGLRLDEAMHNLTLLSVGMYGKVLPNQNGAPIRLIVPWKYGFKSIKSIVSIELTKDEPVTTWQKLAPNEYGFYANVNPNIDHPRWSQARERRLGSFFKQDTLMFNGYEKEVGFLYEKMDLEKYF